MGLRGPAPKPQALKDLAGNPGGRKPLPDPPILPAHVEKPQFSSPEAAQVWDSLVAMLTAGRLVGSVDAFALERYSVLFAEWRKAMTLVQTKGSDYVETDEVVVKGKRKVRVVKAFELPWAKRLRDLNQQLVRIEAQFGMSPSARTRIITGIDHKANGDASSIKSQFLSNQDLKLA